MSRISLIEKYVTDILKNSPSADPVVYAHISIVSRFCTLLALKRGENPELASVCGLLHDVYTLIATESADHALRGSELARSILADYFSEDEITVITDAISCHSEKTAVHSPLAEILKDADVLAHALSDLSIPVRDIEKDRLAKLKTELSF